MRYISLFLFTLITYFSFSQEICDNAIDDDGDGLIDLQDSLDCNCLLTLPPLSLIPNSSFENTLCCPTSYSELSCASSWIQASWGTSDYYNTCGTVTGFVGSVSPQTPIPGNGSGYVGFYAGLGNANAFNEYVGACLNGTMMAGVSYTLSFYTALALGNVSVDIAIFGTPDCIDLPWSSVSCPVGVGGWQEIASQNVVHTAGGIWQQTTITFTPTININAVAIGGTCLSVSNPVSYYYADELTLNETNLFSSISSQGKYCKGNLILSLSAINGSDFQWYHNKVALVGENSSSLNISNYPVGIYTVSFNQDGVGRCIDHEVKAPLYPIANVIPFTDSLCAGEDAILLGDSSLTTVAFDKWYYDFQDGSPNPSVFNVSKEYQNPGNYNIKFVVESEDGCKDSINVPVNVFDVPTAEFEFSANGNLHQPVYGDTITVCGNDSLFFNNLSAAVAPSTIIGYEWNFGDLNTSSLENPAHQFAGIGIYDVSFILETTKGCKDTLMFVIELLERPFADFIFDTNYCENQIVSLVNTSSIVSSTISSYNWDFGDQNQSSAFEPQHHYSLSGNYDIKLVVESTEGCKDSIIKSAVVNPLPISDFIISGFCENDSINFSNQSTVSVGQITNWEWHFGDGNASTLQNINHLYSSSNVYLIELIVVTDQGCRDTLDTLYTISPSPHANFLMSDHCENEAIEIDNVSTLSSGIMNYSWVFQNNINSTLINPPSFSYPISGQYTAVLEVTSDLGCLSSNTQILTIHETPNASILEDSLKGCSPLQVKLSQMQDNIIEQCIWDFGDGTISNECGSVNHVFETGIYDVKLTVISEFGCESSILEDGLVSVTKTPEALFRYSPQIVSVKDDGVQFINESLNASSYIWSFGSEIENSLDTDPTIIFPKEPGTYAISLTALSDNGLCQDETIRIIKVHDDLIFYVPNSFTPDGNGSNEEFNPVMTAGIDVYNYQLIIYNRWGEILLISKAPMYGWDGLYNGEQVSSGVYIWRIDYSILNLDEVITEYGTVNLIR